MSICNSKVKNPITCFYHSDGGVYVQNIVNRNECFIDKTEHTFTCSVDITPDNVLVACGMRNDCFKIFSVQRDPLGRKVI